MSSVETMTARKPRHARPTARYGRMRVLVVAALLVGLVLPSAAVAQAPEGGDPGTGPSLVGRFPRFLSPASIEEVFGEGWHLIDTTGNEKHAGHPVIAPTARLLYQPYALEGPGGFAERMLGIVVRDLDTLEVVGAFTIPELSNFTDLFPTGAREWAGIGLPAAVDEGGGRMFVVPVATSEPWSVEQPVFFTIDEAAVRAGEAEPYTVTSLGAIPGDPQADPRFPANFTSRAGISYADGSLYLVGSRVEQNATPLEVIKIDPADGQADWVRPVRACDGNQFVGESMDATFGVPVLRTQDALYVPCHRSLVPRVVRIPLDAVTDPTGEEQTFIGQGRAHGYLVDEAGGRIHIRTHVARVGPTMLTFDIAEQAWVGLQQLGETGFTTSTAAIGLDPRTGRVYAQTVDEDFGLNVLEGRWTPVEPPLRFPEYAQDEPTSSTAGTVAVVDPPTRRIILSDGARDAREQTFQVVRDTVPLPEPEPRDPDANTTDVEEEEGVTGTLFSGEGSSYGARQQYVGGFRALWPPEAKPTGWHTWPHCFTPDRDIVSARVERTSLGSALQAAKATPTWADLGTRLDLQLPSRCRDRGEVVTPVWLEPIVQDLEDALPPWLLKEIDDSADAHAGQEWKFDWAACPEPTTTRPDDAYLQGFSAEVTCSSEKVTGAAFARPGESEMTQESELPGVRVAEAWASSSTFLDEERGLVTVSEAAAEGIEIAGVVRIAGVYARAETWSKGRPGTNGASFDRKVWGVASPDFSCDLCTDGEALANGLSEALGDRGEARVPEPDPRLVEGTPGGYQAAIQRERFEALSNRLMNGDDLEELPALEVVMYNDTGDGPRRPIYQFAGVLANSQYGIYCLLGQAPDGSCSEPFEPPAPPPPPPSSGAGTDVSGGATGPVESADEFFEEIIEPSRTAQGPSSGMAPVAAREPGSGAEAAPPQSAPEQLYRAIEEGVQWVLREPKEAALAGLMWLLLAAPFYLVWRRRLLNGFVSRPAS